ncbi:MAG: GHMP kinase [Ignavibacteria bacterium]|nr:GHMP kinase [Ignavibacteria bacterium]
MPSSLFSVTTPGRICLFGEHQDYLGLPVIAAAISVHITIEAGYRDDAFIHISMPDIGKTEHFSINNAHTYVSTRDYLRSAVHVMKKYGFDLKNGINATVRGTIPINSGTSSSTALVVSWVKLIAAMSSRAENLSSALAAKYAHEAEVIEFNEPGGMMDHFSTAEGNVQFIEFEPLVKCSQLPFPKGTFVLGDSCEKKDTMGILKKVKMKMLEIQRVLQQNTPEFDLHKCSLIELKDFHKYLTDSEYELLEGTITNRDITAQVRSGLRKNSMNPADIGARLYEHQCILRDTLGISTPKIDRMLDAAMNAGALGGKINGSGGGGCMFAFVQENPEIVAESIIREGGIPYIVQICGGTELSVGE